MSKKNTSANDPMIYYFDMTGDGTKSAGFVSNSITPARDGVLTVTASFRVDTVAAPDSCFFRGVLIDVATSTYTPVAETKVYGEDAVGTVSGVFVMAVKKGGVYGLACASIGETNIVSGYAKYELIY